MFDVERIAEEFHRNGCIRVPGFLSPELLQQVRDSLERYIREVVPRIPAGDRTLESDRVTLRNLWRMQDHDPFFKALAERREICDLIKALVHGEPYLMAVETFNKPPRLGSGVPPHQDNAYFCQTPADALTVWIAIDAATFENGPVAYLLGSHTQGVLPHRPSGVAGNSMGLEKMPPHEKSAEFNGLLEPGDALIHHCQTIHWSAPNRSQSPRCGLLFVYRGTHTAADPQLQLKYDTARAG